MARKRASPVSWSALLRAAIGTQLDARLQALDGYLTKVMHTEANASVATFAWEVRDRLRTGTTRGRTRRPSRWFR